MGRAMSKAILFRRRVDPRMLLVGALVALSCSGNPNRQTLAGLRIVEPDLAEVNVADGVDQAMEGYRKFLEEAPTSTLTPEAMRRLADLKLEKEYGLLGQAKPGAISPSTPSSSGRQSATQLAPATTAPVPTPAASGAAVIQPAGESLRDFEARAANPSDRVYLAALPGLARPGTDERSPSGPLEALALYDQILAAYPDYPHNDQVLYQKARAFDELGRVDEAIEVSAILVENYPDSRHLDEIHFRRAEYYFTRKKFLDAEKDYSSVVAIGPRSDYFELALYKLGWTFYKQMLLPEALQSYVKLLDHKVETAYDFEQTADEADAQRIADSHRVMSLCFSDLGGTEAVAAFFAQVGVRDYEHRVYRNLAEFYLEKLRYQDAADTYEAFVDLYPIHESSPHFSMRVVEIYQAGDFPKLVLEAKKSFASRYALDAEYWRHFDPVTSPEVVAYLKRNLEDLANHYHAVYQNPETPEAKTEAFAESASWYRRFLASFPDAKETPAIHYRLADLLLENEAFGQAANEYEHIAYAYAAHERSAAAGYAAIFAHRKAQQRASDSEQEPIRREAVASTIRFADHFPDHEHTATVLGLAVDDLYDLREFGQAVSLGHRLTSTYRGAAVPIRRSAWLVIGHSSFELGDYAPAEAAYSEVLALTTEDDGSRGGIVNNLAASIYKQGELANEAGDFRGAADHYLRIAQVAPQSDIRPIAEYDAGVALLALEDWETALSVLESFRADHPEHDLHQEATQQVALVYRKTGNSTRAAEEYERVSREAENPELRAESLLIAGELYEESKRLEQALGVYRSYVSEFTRPIETAVVTRFKMTEIYLETGAAQSRLAELRQIVAIDRGAGSERTDGVRGIAARSALLLSEAQFHDFEQITLLQPFEQSLLEKQRRMQATLAALAELVDYQVGEITAAATYYMAEVYENFSRSLLESERPSDLVGGELSDYESALEDEAFPFEEKSIRVHEKNLELMTSGVYNTWTEKSLARLALLVPSRYAKPEESTGPLGSIETYAYRVPASPSLPQQPMPEATTKPSLDATASAPDPAQTEIFPDTPIAIEAAQIPSEEPLPEALPASLDPSQPPQEVTDRADD